MTCLRPVSWVDKFLLQEEMRRLEACGFSFQGQTEEEKLGVNHWILRVGVVEEREKAKKHRRGELNGHEADSGID